MTRIGEVVEATTTAFVAQCYELHQPPPFGSLVKTGNKPLEIYGVVYHAATTSIEPGRRALARGQEEASEADIYRRHPQLAQLLRTDFSALVVGHRAGDRLCFYLPPQPPHLHSFVYLCLEDEMRQFCQAWDFLSLLVQAPEGGEELMAAGLRHLARAQDDRHTFLVAAGKELTRLLGGEPQRLNSILRRIRP